MKLTFDEIIKGGYDLKMRTEYEVALGVYVQMKKPTSALRDEFLPRYIEMVEMTSANADRIRGEKQSGKVLKMGLEAQADIDAHSKALAQLVTDGDWPDDSAVFPRAAFKIVNDFLALVMLT